MTKEQTTPKKQRNSIKNFILIAIVLILNVWIPLLLLNYQATCSGMTMGEVIGRITNKLGGSEKESSVSKNKLTGYKIYFLIPTAIGQKFTEAPLISHLQAVDLDGDGLLDVIDCDAKSNTVNWIRQYPAGVYTESVLASELIAPAHVQAIDFDKYGDLDLMVGVLGMLFPNKDKIGSVVILENDGHANFKKYLVIDKICLLYTSDAADEEDSVDLGGRRIIKKKKKN